ncbi:MAG TPA: hypothetical protein VGT24_09435 [Candidatus Acidoferrales bacterium]|nr:hypothetical protein [Candidatus Acidoferrales bacterium]
MSVDRSKTAIRLYDTPADNADYTQRTAASEDDPYLEQAERILRSMAREDGLEYLAHLGDSERQEFIEQLADGLRGESSKRKIAAQPEERPKSQRERDNEFWGSDEPQKVMPKKL